MKKEMPYITESEYVEKIETIVKLEEELERFKHKTKETLEELEKYGLNELEKSGAFGALKSKQEQSAYWAGYAAASRNAINKCGLVE